jgi:hypothetical protein
MPFIYSLSADHALSLRSVLIGLTLAVDERFITLFIVIVFHRM